jgi:hypothetical protein
MPLRPFLAADKKILGDTSKKKKLDRPFAACAIRLQTQKGGGGQLLVSTPSGDMADLGPCASRLFV